MKAPRFLYTSRRWSFIHLVWLGLVPATISLAQASGPTIKEIRIIGVAPDRESAVRGQLRSAVGQAYDAQMLDQDRGRLLASGRFLNVETATEEQPDGVVITVTVSERADVQAIEFSGNHKFNTRELTDAVGIKVGEPVDLFAARQGRLSIIDKYREKGFGHVVVTLDEAAAREGTIRYAIEEGPRVRIRKISFEGVTAFKEDKLQEKIESQTYLWILRDGKFDVDTVETDAAAIQKFYRDEGYLDARASYRLEFDGTRERLTLVFVVSEGIRYRLDHLVIEGNEAYTTDELMSLVSLKPGDFLRLVVLEGNVKAITEKYQNSGYIYAEIEAQRAFLEVEGQAAITLKVSEGDQFTVGRIVVRGNERTKDKVVRRALELFPGDIFDLSRTTEAEQALKQSQIFNLAKITPVGEEPGVRDVVMDVEEAPEAGNIIFGAGVTSNNGLVGSIVLDIKNFDLYDTPRSFGEFIRGRSFHGAGQRLRIEARPGTEVSQFRLDFTEPYLFDRPITFGTSAYYFTRDRDGYDEERVGGNFSFGKRLRRGWLKGWYGEIAFKGELVEVGNVDIFAPRVIREDEGSNGLTSVKVGIARDKTDSRFLPSKGDVWRFSWEQFGALGGDHIFGKASASYSKYFTLHVDEEERKHILELRARVGAIAGDAPVFETLYAGGIGSLRGFGYRGVSPREGLTKTAVGGDFQLLTGAEYSFPIVTRLLRGAVFTDMGTVEEDFEITGWRATAGLGVRLMIEQLGSVPMEFDFAWPISSEEDDDEQVFSFLIGITF